MFHQPIAISTTSNASALLVLSLTFGFLSTKHQLHFRDASFFSKKTFSSYYAQCAKFAAARGHPIWVGATSTWLWLALWATDILISVIFLPNFWIFGQILVSRIIITSRFFIVRKSLYIYLSLILLFYMFFWSSVSFFFENWTIFRWEMFT